MRRRQASGVTLIELMVVMSILAVLMGVGMAMLTESNKDKGLRSSRGQVLGMCRYARTAARHTRAPVTMRIDPEGKWISMVTRKAMGAWHFESEPLTGAFNLPAALTGGKLYDEGRIGRCVLFSDSGGHVDCGNVPMFSRDQGLLVEVWYRPRLHKRTRVLVEKSGEFGIGLDKAGVLQAFVGVEADRVAVIATGAPIPENRWAKISLAWDGKALTLSVNDHPLVRKTGTATFAMGDAPLLIGSKEYPLDGAVDEVRVDALIESQRTQLRDPITVSGPPEVRWDESGALDPALHAGAVTLTVRSPADSSDITINLLGGSQ